MKPYVDNERANLAGDAICCMPQPEVGTNTGSDGLLRDRQTVGKCANKAIAHQLVGHALLLLYSEMIDQYESGDWECAACGGSGEGSYDGSSCTACRGTGGSYGGIK